MLCNEQIDNEGVKVIKNGFVSSFLHVLRRLHSKQTCNK